MRAVGRDAGKALGLRLEEMRRGVVGVAGFSEWMWDRFGKRISAAGKELAVMEENGQDTFVAERWVNEIFRERGVCHA